MKLVAGHGLSLELAPVGYQFPEVQDDEWDSNWLVVQGRIEHPRGVWTFRDPCLTTFEVEQLAQWLDGVASGHVDAGDGYFTEPNLEFAYLPSPLPAIEVRFAFESAPPWLDGDERSEGEVVTFPLALNDLHEAALSLRDWLAKFPPRANRRG